MLKIYITEIFREKEKCRKNRKLKIALNYSEEIKKNIEKKKRWREIRGYQKKRNV